MNDLVEMTHPDLPGRTIKVAPQAVPHHEASRWVRAVVREVVDLVHHGRENGSVVGTPADDEVTEAGATPAATANEGGATP